MLGLLDQLTDSLDAVISGLLKVTGQLDVLGAQLPAVEFESALALGHVRALNELRENLGFSQLRRVFKTLVNRSKTTLSILFSPVLLNALSYAITPYQRALRE